MKRVLFLLLVSVFMLPAFHSEAQVQGTQTPTHYQELTKQQQRQVKRDLRKKAREVANQQAFNAAVDALKDRNWVLMASTLYGPRGSAIPVSDNTNFIQFKGNTVYVQLAFNRIAGRTVLVESPYRVLLHKSPPIRINMEISLIPSM